MYYTDTMSKPRKPLTEEQKQRAIQRTRDWLELNPHKAKAYRKEYYRKNRDKMLAVSRERAKAKPEEAKKAVERCRSGKPWYGSWIGAKSRCTNPRNASFQRYGGRGIEFHLSKEDMALLWDRDGAAKMDYPVLDRIDTDGNYTSENCQFIEHRDKCRRETGYAKVKHAMERLGRWTAR